MIVAMATLGSYGDFRPCLFLGRELVKGGHTVRLITHAKYEQDCKDNGIEFYDMGGSVDDFMKAAVGSVDENGFNMNVFGAFKAYFKKCNPTFRAATLKALDGADILLYFYAASAATIPAEAMGIPYVRFNFIPDLPSPEFPTVGWPKIWLPFGLTKVYNKISYRVSKYFALKLFTSGFDDWAKEYGLKMSKIGKKHQDGKPIEALFPCGSVLFKQSKDYPESAHFIGYWNDASKTVNYTPDKELEDFLSAGEKPVFIGFGSMTDKNPEQLKSVIIDAAKKCKKRILLQAGWVGFTADDLPDNVHLVEFIPHEWLFNQVCGVVIHGGAGTTASALKAGKPILVVPFGTDQNFWGANVHNSGYGPAPIPREQLTADNLSAAICELCDNGTYKEAAQKAAEIMASENGVAQAVDFINDYINK
ncbi:MAG: glycosyltransferase [Clostridia bacterium]|nr:glycosyltransferase [Clostridia bacterium]